MEQSRLLRFPVPPGISERSAGAHSTKERRGEEALNVVWRERVPVCYPTLGKDETYARKIDTREPPHMVANSERALERQPDSAQLRQCL